MNSDVYRRELLVRDELLLLLLLREFELELREEVLEELPDELLLREFDTELLDELFDDGNVAVVDMRIGNNMDQLPCL